MMRFLKKIYRFLIHFKKKMGNIFLPTAYIVLYHRIAKTGSDPHRLCTDPENFREQLKFLKENFHIVPLAQMVRWVREGKLKNNSLAITFDDGYADNLYNALPILKELNIPATIFATAGSAAEFYWDEQTPTKDRGRPMTKDELREIAGCNLIEIGAHTITHPKLRKIGIAEQQKEIAESKKSIENIIGTPLLSFAYPFGCLDSFDQNTIRLVKESGFSHACANIHERVTNRSDIYALPRFIARDWNLEEFKKQIKNWI